MEAIQGIERRDACMVPNRMAGGMVPRRYRLRRTRQRRRVRGPRSGGGRRRQRKIQRIDFGEHGFVDKHGPFFLN